MSRLHPDTMLSIELSAICSRNCYTHDPQPVIDELRTVAGHRVDILAAEAGRWSGFCEQDKYCQPLVRAIQEQIPGIDDAVALGRQRAGERPHGTDGFRSPVQERQKTPDQHP